LAGEWGSALAPTIRLQAVLTHVTPAPNNFSGMTDDEQAVLARWRAAAGAYHPASEG
jgi:uncharacterized membrane protein